MEYSFRPDNSVENVLTHMGINGRQWIVQEVDISLSVNGSGQAHSLLLSAGQVQALRKTRNPMLDKVIKTKDFVVFGQQVYSKDSISSPHTYHTLLKFC